MTMSLIFFIKANFLTFGHVNSEVLMNVFILVSYVNQPDKSSSYKESLTNHFQILLLNNKTIIRLLYRSHIHMYYYV